MIFEFGKYRGCDLKNVPRDYIEWLIATREKEMRQLAEEIERRNLIEQAQTSMSELIVQAGFRALALKFHPDQGGDPEKFKQLKAAQEQLRAVLREI